MPKTITSLAAATLLISSLAVGAPAHAEPTHAVSYSDLDLGTATGQKALSDRLRWAVRSVCGTPNPSELRAVMDNRRCRWAASGQAANAAEGAIALYQAQAERLATRR